MHPPAPACPCSAGTAGPVGMSRLPARVAPEVERSQAAALAALAAERDGLAGQLAALGREFEAMVAASETSNADDEHDPEGATIAFERAQLVALISGLQARLAEVAQAADRLAGGDYGRCEQCGAPIGAERLAARPSARTCIGCARAAGAGPRSGR